jgi:O-acetyl-ADP-ribose deacetylase (regulator of RNase III)
MTPNETIRTLSLPGESRLELIHGDLLSVQADAIVNPANRHLEHGGGVAGLIVRRGGWKIQEESNAWIRDHGSVSHTKPAVTSAGSLPFKHIIHAVGPVWGEGQEDEKLGQAVTGVLQTASDLNCRSLALPAISTGIFGFPLDRAARVILAAVRRYFSETSQSSLVTIQIVLFDKPALQAFIDALDEY